MTEPGQAPLDPEIAARVERLQQRHVRPSGAAPKPDRTRRPRLAKATRIAALGLGGTTMFGLAAAMAMAEDSSSGNATAPPTQQQQPIVVVIHTGGVPITSAPTSPVVAATEPAAPVGDLGTARPTAVELRAKPVVTTVELQASAPATAPVPAAKTNGSR